MSMCDMIRRDCSAHTAVIMSYYCRCVPGVVIVEPIALWFLFFGGNSRGYWVYYRRCSVFPPRLSVIESGSVFFTIRYDLINIGLFIGNRVFWPLSDRNRFSSRYPTLVTMMIVTTHDVRDFTIAHQVPCIHQ